MEVMQREVEYATQEQLQKRLDFIQGRRRAWHETTPVMISGEEVQVDLAMAPLVEFLNGLPNTRTSSCCQAGYVYLRSDLQDLRAFKRRLGDFLPSGEVGHAEQSRQTEIIYEPMEREDFRYRIVFHDEITVWQMAQDCFGLEAPPEFSQFFGQIFWPGDIKEIANRNR